MYKYIYIERERQQIAGNPNLAKAELRGGHWDESGDMTAQGGTLGEPDHGWSLSDRHPKGLNLGTISQKHR